MLQDHSHPTIIEEKVNKTEGKVLIKRYKKGKFLGKGGFGRVYHLEDLESHQVFAAKQIPKSTLANLRNRQKLMTEIKIHKSLSHPNIVKLVHHFEDFENVYILLEYCSERTLSDLVRAKTRLTEAERRSIF